eukprot:ANDGO_04394.mRNA.1 Eukaryotic translation initiation factor 3 subunit M
MSFVFLYSESYLYSLVNLISERTGHALRSSLPAVDDASYETRALEACASHFLSFVEAESTRDAEIEAAGTVLLSRMANPEKLFSAIKSSNHATRTRAKLELMVYWYNSRPSGSESQLAAVRDLLSFVRDANAAAMIPMIGRVEKVLDDALGVKPEDKCALYHNLAQVFLSNSSYSTSTLSSANSSGTSTPTAAGSTTGTATGIAFTATSSSGGSATTGYAGSPRLADGYRVLLKALRCASVLAKVSPVVVADAEKAIAIFATEMNESIRFADELSSAISKNVLASLDEAARSLLPILTNGTVAQWEDWKSRFGAKAEFDVSAADKKIRGLVLAEFGGQMGVQKVSYADVARVLFVSEDKVEAFVCAAVEARLVQVRMNQVAKTMVFGKTTQRVFEQQQWSTLAKRLASWSSKVQTMGRIMRDAVGGNALSDF